MMNLGVIVVLRDSFSREADRIRSSYENMSDGITRLNGIIGHSMYQTWNGISLMAKGFAATLPLAFSVREAAAFEKQLAAIQTVWEYGNESLDVQKQKIGEISDEIRGLSLEIGTDPLDTASGMYTILQANITDTAEAMNLLELSQKSAIAGLTTTEDASKALISLRNAYGLNADEMKTVTDQLFQALAVGVMNFDDFSLSLGKSIGIVRQAGLELPEYFALKATATLSGMTASQTDSGIRQALQELFQPKEKASIDMMEQMKDLGALPSNFEFSTKYMNEQAGSFHAFLEEIYAGAVALEDLGTAVDKNGLSMTADKVMGRLFNDMEGLAFVLNVVGSQGEAYNDVLEQINNSQGKLEDSYEKIAGTLIHKWEKLLATLKNFMIVVGTPLLKFLGIVVTGLTKFLEVATKLFEKVPALTWVLLALTVAVSGMFIAIGLVITVMGLYTLAVIGLSVVLPHAMLMIRNFALTTLRTLQRVFPVLVLLSAAAYILKEAWQNNWGGMRDSLTLFWDRLKLVAGGLWELIKTTENGIGSLSKETAEALQNAGLFDFVVTLYMWWYRLKLFWDGFKTGFTDAIDHMLNKAKELSNSASPVLQKIGDAILWVAQQIGLLSPDADSAKAWQDAGEWVGKFAAQALLVFMALSALGRIVGVIKFLIAPFRILWGVVKMVWWALKLVGTALRHITVANLVNAFWNIFNFVSAIVRGVMHLITGVEKLLSFLWRIARPVITILTWVVRIAAAILGVSAGWVVVIGLAVAAVVGLIIRYWDEISAFFVNLWADLSKWGSDAWAEIQTAWAGAGEWFNGHWSTVTEGAAEAWSGVEDAWSGFTDWADDLWTGITDGANEAWSGVQSAWTSATSWFDTTIWQPLSDGMSALWDGIAGFALGCWEFIRGAWIIAVYWFEQLFGPIAEYAAELWSDIADAAADAWQWTQDTWNAAGEWFMSNIVTPISQFFQFLWGVVAYGAQAGWQWLQDTWATAADWFLNDVIEPITVFFGILWDGVVQLAQAGWQWTQDTWVAAGEWFGANVITPLTTFFTDLWNYVWGAAQAAWGWITGIWGTANEWFHTTVLTPLQSAFTELWSGVESAAQGAWDWMVGVWTPAAEWFDLNVVQPVMEVWNYLVDGAVEVAQGAWDGFTSILGGLAEWFTTNVIDPIVGAWGGIGDIITSGINLVGDGINAVRDIGRSGEYKGEQRMEPMEHHVPKSKSTPAPIQSIPGPGGARGMATGGYIKPGKEGLAYLHQDELVINSPTYNALKDFLKRPSDALGAHDPMAPEITMPRLEDAQADIRYSVPEIPQPDQPMPYEPPPEDSQLPAPPEQNYTYQLADHKETRQPAPFQEDSSMTQLIGQMQQMMQSIQRLAERPVQVTSVLNGREIGRSVDSYNREQDARRY